MNVVSVPRDVTILFEFYDMSVTINFGFVIYTIMLSASAVSSNMNNMSLLNGSNFKDRKDYILIALSCMDRNYALRIEQPTSPTDDSTSYQRRNYEK